MKHAPLSVIAFLCLLQFSPAVFGGIVSAFHSATTELNSIGGTQLSDTVNGAGLTPTATHDTTYLHVEADPNNAWIFQTNEQVLLTVFNVYLELSGVNQIDSLTGIDAFYLWNLNKGDSRRVQLDNDGNPITDGNGDPQFYYLDQSYWGISGVKMAKLSYTDTKGLNALDFSALSNASWTEIGDFSFYRETGVTSSSQEVNFAAPVYASFLKLTLLSPFGNTLGSDGSTSVTRIGFSELAYREYVAPAPPVVPEPGSVAVFGGLMATCGWMRRRRRRSVAG